MERSEKERRDFLREASYIVRLFAPHQITVVPSWDGSWSCGFSIGSEMSEIFNDYVEGRMVDIDSIPDEKFQPDEIQYGEKGVQEYPRKVLYGILRHEVGHAKRSSYKSIAKGAKHAKNEGALPSSLTMGMNFVEDCWMENVERRESKASQEQLNANKAYHIPDNIEALKEGCTPLHRQLGVRILFHNAVQRGLMTQAQIEELEKDGFNKEVIKAFRDIQPAVEKYFDPRQTPEKNYRLYIDKIWPAFKQFEYNDIQDEMLKKLVNPKTKAEKEMAKALKRDIRRMMKREFKRQQKEAEKEGKVDGEKESNGKGDKESLIGKIRKTIFGKGKGNEKEDFRPDKMPDELQKAIQKEFERMKKENPNLHKEVEKSARKEVDKSQVEEMKKDMPAGMEMEENKDGEFEPKLKPSDHKKAEDRKKELEEFSKEDDKDQFKEREEIMEKIEEVKSEKDLEDIEENEELPPNHEEEIREAMEKKKEQIEEERKKREVEMEKLGFRPEELNLYMDYMVIEREVEREMKWYVEKLAEILPKKKDITYDGAYYKGPKIKDRRGMVQKILTGRGNIYQRPDITETPKPQLFLVLLIDRSGSMGGSKMTETLKTAVMFNRLSEVFNMPVSILFFDDEVEEVKTLAQDFSAPEAKIKAKFMRAAQKNDSGTDIELAVNHAETELNGLRRRFADMGGILLTFTDGLDNLDAKPKIDEINKRHPIIAMYLGSNGDADADHELPVEALFGSRQSGKTVVVGENNIHKLRQHAFFAFKRAAQFLQRRYQ